MSQQTAEMPAKASRVQGWISTKPSKNNGIAMVGVKFIPHKEITVFSTGENIDYDSAAGFEVDFEIQIIEGVEQAVDVMLIPKLAISQGYI